MRLSYAELVSENPLEFFENRFANEKLVLREHEFQDVMTEPASREGRDQDICVQLVITVSQTLPHAREEAQIHHNLLYYS